MIDLNKGGWCWVENGVAEMAHTVGVTAVAVYLVLARHADEDRNCYPSEATIGRMIGKTDRTVRTAITRLQNAGWVQVERRHNKGQTSNGYHLPPLQPPEASFRSPDQPEVSFRGGRKSVSGHPRKPASAKEDIREEDQKKKTRKRSSGNLYPPEFEEWWEAYPRKVGKRTASVRWMTVTNNGISPAELLKVTKIFAASDKGQSGQYCPYPTTWLNQGRWEDDPKEWQDRNGRTVGIGQAHPQDLEAF